MIAFARYRSEALEHHANVVFPAEIYAEKEGTVTHPDGRVQRVRETLGQRRRGAPRLVGARPVVRARGQGVDALAAPRSLAEVTAAVPMYAGLDLEEIGGLGVRWQDRDAASRVPVEELLRGPAGRPARPADRAFASSCPDALDG